MRKNTKLYQILRFIYLNRGRAVSAKEIFEDTGVKPCQVSCFLNRLNRSVGKKVINKRCHYYLRQSEEDFVREKIKNAT